MPDNSEEKAKTSKTTQMSEKYSEVMNKIKDDETVQKGKAYVQKNLFEAIFSILLVIGFIISLFFPEFGGAVVGLFGGIALSPQCAKLFGKLMEYYKSKKRFVCFTIFAIALTELFIIPAFLIAFIVGLFLRWFIQPSKHSFTGK